MANLSDLVIVEEPPYKVILAGMKGVGKTSLMQMLDQRICSDFDERSILFSMNKGESSRGRTKLTLQTECHGRSISVQVWDTDDMETHSGSLGMTKSYFRDAHGAILIYEKSREETKAELQTWAQFTKAESPECVLSLWCNNRMEEFGRGDATRDFISTLESHYRIPSHLMFSYTSPEQVHHYFNRLMCEICSRVPQAIARNSIKLGQSSVQNTQATNKKKCCPKS